MIHPPSNERVVARVTSTVTARPAVLQYLERRVPN